MAIEVVTPSEENGNEVPASTEEVIVTPAVEEAVELEEPKEGEVAPEEINTESAPEAEVEEDEESDSEDEEDASPVEESAE